MQKKAMWFFAGAMLLLLHGCATGYYKRGLTGGYHEVRVDDTHYVVSFDGNGFATKDRVWYFWIYRCAELTRQKGYVFFNLKKDEHLGSYVPDQDADGKLQPAVLTGQDDGRIIDAHGGGFIYVPGGTITTWHSKAMVSMFGDDAPARMMLIKAQSILDLLGAYVRSEGKISPPDLQTIFDASTFVRAPDNSLVNLHQYLLAHPRRRRPPPPPPPPPPPQGTPAWLKPPFLVAPGQKA